MRLYLVHKVIFSLDTDKKKEKQYNIMHPMPRVKIPHRDREWEKQISHDSLLLQGARQISKTYIAKLTRLCCNTFYAVFVWEIRRSLQPTNISNHMTNPKDNDCTEKTFRSLKKCNFQIHRSPHPSRLGEHMTVFQCFLWNSENYYGDQQTHWGPKKKLYIWHWKTPVVVYVIFAMLVLQYISFRL